MASHRPISLSRRTGIKVGTLLKFLDMERVLEIIKSSRNKKYLNDVTVFGVFLLLAAKKKTPKTGQL